MHKGTVAALCLLLTGCGGNTDVAEAMEAALQSANHTIAIGLISSDIASYHVEAPAETGTTDTGLRHGDIGPCPELIDLGDGLVELDYGSGCLPRSGLLPVVASGHVYVERNGDGFTGEFSEFALNITHPIEGAISGTTVVDGSGLVVDTEANIDASDADNALSATTSVHAEIGIDAVTLQGDTVLDLGDGKRSNTLRKLKLGFGDIPGECPEPRTGTFTVDDDPEVAVDFGAPGNGRVTVTRGGRTSEDVRLCAFDSWIF